MSDVSFMSETLANIGSWVEQNGTLYSYTAGTFGGTASEAGEPSGLAFGTSVITPRVEHIDMKDMERSGGRYQASDMRFSIRGTYTDDDLIGWQGTYTVIDGPWTF